MDKVKVTVKRVTVSHHKENHNQKVTHNTFTAGNMTKVVGAAAGVEVSMVIGKNGGGYFEVKREGKRAAYQAF